MEGKGLKKKKKKENRWVCIRSDQKDLFPKKSCNKTSSILNKDRGKKIAWQVGFLWFCFFLFPPFILPLLSLLLCSFLNQKQFCHSERTPDVQHWFWQLQWAGFLGCEGKDEKGLFRFCVGVGHCASSAFCFWARGLLSSLEPSKTHLQTDHSVWRFNDMYLYYSVKWEGEKKSLKIW